MADLDWDAVQCFFDSDLMGALPDLHVPDASIEGWQAVLDLIQQEGWKSEYAEGHAVSPEPAAQVVLSRPADAEFA